MRTRSLALLLTAMLLLASCAGGDDAADAPTADTDSAMGSVESTQGSAGLGSRSTAPEAAQEDSDTDTAADDEAPADAAGGQPPMPATPTAARPGDRLIKEGTMTIEVDAGSFEQGFMQVVSVARRYGGSVVSSTSTANRDGGTSGSVTIRVPVDRYEDLLVGVGDIGEVLHRDITAQDVTAEFTDIESRLRHARAQEQFYLGLLDEAESVADAIAVQQQLDGIQSTIEQLQGRLNLLDDRTSFSTLTVELVEPGASPVIAEGERPSFAHYLATAKDAFITVVGSVLVVGVALAPLLLPVLAGLLLWRGLGRRTPPATVAGDA